jgi:hypothetical protein
VVTFVERTGYKLTKGSSALVNVYVMKSCFVLSVIYAWVTCVGTSDL